MVNCKDDEIEHQGVCVGIEDRFNQLMKDVPTSIFWKWVESWKDPDALVYETENWDAATKKQSIWDIEKLIEERAVKHPFIPLLNSQAIDRVLSSMPDSHILAAAESRKNHGK